MIQTLVIFTEANYNRNAYLDIIDNKVRFDCSNEEYGPIEFDLELLEQKIKEHKEKLNES